MSIFAILIAIFSFSAFAEDKDYSRPGSTSKITFGSADILEIAFGIEITDAEEKYLSLYGEESISYGSHIPSSRVRTEYDAENQILSVFAEPYTYNTADYTQVSWIPVCAVVGNDEKELILSSDEKYTASFESVAEAESLELKVIYNTDILIPMSTLNSLVNKAYDEAVLWDAYDTYIVKCDEHEEKSAKYQQYLADKSVYDEKLSDYKAYIGELSEYEVNLKLYNSYKVALEKYNADYLLYLEYLSEKESYDAKLNLYNKYVENLSIAKSQLAIIEGTWERGPLGRSVYHAIMGDMVKSVMENKDLIANEFVGASGEAVDMAGDMTDVLKAMYAEYRALETEDAKYTYYSINYERFRDAFVNLFKALDKLYSNAKVRIAIDEEGKKEKFEILLAQLYYVTMAISDVPVMNFDGTAYYGGDYRVNGKTPLSIHRDKPYMLDTGRATPLADGYPTPVEKPVVTEVAKPTKPTLVAEPIKPEAVADPGAAPAVVPNPGNAPIPVNPPRSLTQNGKKPEGIDEIIELYKAGSLVRRNAASSSFDLECEIVLKKDVFGTKTVRVVFMDTDGVTQLGETLVDYGTYAEFLGRIPIKVPDVSARYTFVGWQDADGNPVDITNIRSEGDLVLYPRFLAETKSYRVAWEIDGVISYTECLYGTVPAYDKIPTKADEDDYYYTFVGWDREFTAVTGEMTEAPYSAIFEEHYIASIRDYSSERDLGGAVIIHNSLGWTLDCTQTRIGQRYTTLWAELSGVISRVGVNESITVVSDYFTAKFTYADAMAMKAAGVHGFSMESVQSKSAYYFNPMLFDSNGEEIADGLRVSVSFPKYTFVDPESTKLCYDAGGERKYVKASINKNSLEAVVVAGKNYYTVAEYSLNVMSSKPITLSADKTLCTAGTLIRVNYPTIPGIEIISLYLLDEDGIRTNIKGKSFEMPAYNATLGVEWKYIEYTVNFISAGKIISSRVYRYGEKPVIPPEPFRTSDNEYSYKFLTWSAPVVEVTKDVDYEALYLKEKLPEKEKGDGLQISDSVFKLIVEVAFAAGFAILVFIPCAIIVIVKVVNRVCRKPAPKKKKKP